MAYITVIACNAQSMPFRMIDYICFVQSELYTQSCYQLHRIFIHLGKEDMPIATARRILGDDFIIGATAKTVPWAMDVAAQGADYLGVGAIYPTTTKVITVLTSTATLHDICNAVSIPVNAIGGLNKDNIDVLSGIPIAGICAVSAIMKADDPKAAASELKARAKELGLC